KGRDIDNAKRRLALAEGSPGLAVGLDLETYDRRRTAMLTLMRVAAGLEQFGACMKHSDSIGARKTEKLGQYIEVLYSLVEDALRVLHGEAAMRNADIQR